ncbi:hypothetical protein ACWFPY_25210 [Nocardia fluminea]
MHDSRTEGFDNWPHEPHFREDGFALSLCKKGVRVVLPSTFREDEPQVCDECARRALFRAKDVEGWESRRKSDIRAGRLKQIEREEMASRDADWEEEYTRLEVSHPNASEIELVAMTNRRIGPDRPFDAEAALASIERMETRRETPRPPGMRNPFVEGPSRRPV